MATSPKNNLYPAANDRNKDAAINTADVKVAVAGTRVVHVAQPFEIPKHLQRTSVHYRLLSFKQSASEIGCGFVHIRPTAKRVFHSNPEYYGLIQILIGSGTLVTKDKQTFKVGPGDVIQFPRSSLHTLLPDTNDWLEATTSLDHSLIERFMLLNDFDINQPVLRLSLSMSLLRQFEMIHDMLMAQSREQLPLFMLRLQELIFHIHHACRAYPASNPEHHQLEQACLLLDDKSNFNLNLEQIAQKLQIEYRQLRYLFKKHLGESPGQFRLKRKMAAASAMLIHDQHSVAHIAQVLGYADPFTFSRQFKQFHGVSPRKYRG